jgi:hypothetical protein
LPVPNDLGNAVGNQPTDIIMTVNDYGSDSLEGSFRVGSRSCHCHQRRSWERLQHHGLRNPRATGGGMTQLLLGDVSGLGPPA